MRTIRRVAGLLSLLGSVAVWAQTNPGKYVWEEFDQRIKASEKVAPLGPNIAGDQVRLSNGALSFSATDVSLPGSNALKVEFTRTYSVFSRKHYGDLGMLADWLVDVPNVSAVFAPDWVVGSASSTARCSSGLIPEVSQPFTANDFWQGLQISIPGKTNSELLRTLPGVQTPTDGPSHYWVTNDRVHVSCLTSILNGTGEGFLARTPDGVRYWFDWMGQTPEPGSKQKTFAPGDTVGVEHWLSRKKNYLYVTRVEDRFGNYVSYTYTNAWNQPGKLTQIQGGDGRTLSIGYVGATISTVSDGTRTWSYAYGTTASGRKNLASVGLPDGSAWTINLGLFTNAQIEPNVGAPRSCTGTDAPINILETFVGSVVHPAGATAQFTLDIQEYGNSYVPVSCRNVQTQITSGPNKGADNNQNDDVNTWPTWSYALTLKEKTISGPGQAPATWTYTYQPNDSVYMYPGTTALWPLCDWANVDCSQPPCTNDNCARYSITTVSGPNNEWRRYYHGNTYRYNEGKLLREEAGTGPMAVLRVDARTYNLSLTTGPVCRVGTSLRPSGDGFAAEYPRPETKVELVQQGVKFMRNVDQFDQACRPTQVTRSSTPAGAPSDPPPANPPAPTLTAPATSVAGEGHTLSWTSVSGAAAYVLERQFNGGSFGVVYSGVSTSQVASYTNTGTLKYRVKACNTYGSCGAYSAENTLTITPAALGTPTLSGPPSQVVAGAGHNAIWNAISGATQYVLERKVGSGSFTVVYNGGSLNASMTYPSPTTLKYRVKACNAVGACGTYSAERTTLVVSGGGGGIEP